MYDFEAMREVFEAHLSKQNFGNTPIELYDPIYYTLDLGGKRVRPLLVLMANEIYGGDTMEAMPASMAIEMFHNFTLVHDDIMDNAPIRRGKETVHKRWNPNTAILAGDTMLTLCYDLMLELKEPMIKPVLEIFNRTSIEVCEGQQMDINFESRTDVTLQEYIEMIRLKTSVLIAASLKIGAVIAGAPSAEANVLYDFGIKTGIAFQLMDDLLDVYGDQDLFGKQNSGDIVANKKTYLFLRSLELANDNELELLRYYFSRPFDDNSKKIEDVKEIYNRLRIKHLTQDTISSYYNEAISLLDMLNISDQKKAWLSSFANQLIERKY